MQQIGVKVWTVASGFSILGFFFLFFFVLNITGLEQASPRRALHSHRNPVIPRHPIPGRLFRGMMGLHSIPLRTLCRILDGQDGANLCSSVRFA